MVLGTTTGIDDQVNCKHPVNIGVCADTEACRPPEENSLSAASWQFGELLKILNQFMPKKGGK